MTLKEKIEQDLTSAMRAKDALKLGALRLLKAAIVNKEVALKVAALDDAGVLQVISSLLKQRQDAADQYKAAGRQDLADAEVAEAAVLQAYMPQQLTAAEVTAEVAKAIADAGAKGPKDMGTVMKALGHLRGKADGKAISDEVKVQLAQLQATA